MGAVRPVGVVEVDVGGQSGAHGADRLAALEADILVLDALSQPLNRQLSVAKADA